MGAKMIAYMPQYIEQPVTEDIHRKIVFISGPRQSGKTTLAKHFCQKAGVSIKDRLKVSQSLCYLSKKFPSVVATQVI
jgi:predicted AAA+ superfamily ATPase